MTWMTKLVFKPVKHSADLDRLGPSAQQLMNNPSFWGLGGGTQL